MLVIEKDGLKTLLRKYWRLLTAGARPVVPIRDELFEDLEELSGYCGRFGCIGRRLWNRDAASEPALIGE
jgi:hypothetical protein